MTDERLREAVERRKAAQHLLTTDGWKVVASLLEENCAQTATEIVTKPLENNDKTLHQEFRKGVVMGIRFALQMPNAIIEDADLVIESLRTPQKEVTIEAAGEEAA